MDVVQTDCGRITGAGEYRFRDGHLIVTLHQIAIWTRYPNAIFTAVPSRLGTSIRIYVLASWRLPDAGPDVVVPAASAEGMSLR